MRRGAAIRCQHRAGEDAPEVVGRARPRIGLVADVGHRDLGQLRDVVHAHASCAGVGRQRSGNAQLLLQSREPVDERVRACFVAAATAARHVRDARELGELRGGRRQVEAHHVIDHDAVREPVMQVGHRGQRVRAGMHGAEVFLKRDRAHHRAHQHVAARGHIVSVRNGRRQRACRDAHALDGDPVAQRMPGR